MAGSPPRYRPLQQPRRLINIYADDLSELLEPPEKRDDCGYFHEYFSSHLNSIRTGAYVPASSPPPPNRPVTMLPFLLLRNSVSATPVNLPAYMYRNTRDQQYNQTDYPMAKWDEVREIISSAWDASNGDHYQYFCNVRNMLVNSKVMHVVTDLFTALIDAVQYTPAGLGPIEAFVFISAAADQTRITESGPVDIERMMKVVIRTLKNLTMPVTQKRQITVTSSPLYTSIILIFCARLIPLIYQCENFAEMLGQAANFTQVLLNRAVLEREPLVIASCAAVLGNVQAATISFYSPESVDIVKASHILLESEAIINAVAIPRFPDKYTRADPMYPSHLSFSAMNAIIISYVATMYERAVPYITLGVMDAGTKVLDALFSFMSKAQRSSSSIIPLLKSIQNNILPLMYAPNYLVEVCNFAAQLTVKSTLPEERGAALALLSSIVINPPLAISPNPCQCGITAAAVSQGRRAAIELSKGVTPERLSPLFASLQLWFVAFQQVNDLEPQSVKQFQSPVPVTDLDTAV